jgi:DNA gyrase subunit B
MSEEKLNPQYSADSIQALEGMEHVRMRPSMYIGDIGARGLHHLVYEVVDNSIDEALAGYCDTISVIINEDNSITTEDNGRGIPVGMHKKEGVSALEVVMTKIGAGGKFDKDSYKVSGGLHGVGVSCVNALSEKLTATVFREGKVWEQIYERGKPLTSVQETGTSDKKGTVVTFKPDPQIFQQVLDYNYDTLAQRMRELSFLNKGITINLTDKRRKDEKGKFIYDKFFSDEGLKEFIRFLDSNREPIVQNVIFMEGEKNGIPVEVAMIYNTSFNENLHSYVNNINTHEGGTHLSGFRRGLTGTLKKYADASGLLDKLKFDIAGDDFREGLTAIVSVKVGEPQFEGQTKTKLGNREVSAAVSQSVSEMLENYLEEHPNDAKLIVQKVILAAQARHAARKAREMVQRKTVMTGGGLPGKLSDCSEQDPVICEVFFS